MKICSECYKEKILIEFPKKGNRCKKCTSIHDRAYYLKNKEKITQQKKTYRAKNKEKITQQKRLYKAKNKEKITQQRKLYEAKNKEKITQRKKIYNALFYLKNNEKIAIKNKAWRERNKQYAAMKYKIWAEKNKWYLKEYRKTYWCFHSIKKANERWLKREYKEPKKASKYHAWRIDGKLDFSLHDLNFLNK